MDQKIIYILLVVAAAIALGAIIFFYNPQPVSVGKSRIHSYNILSSIQNLGVVDAADAEVQIMADTIYGEARGELAKSDGGLASIIAVANVIVNRVAKRSEDYGLTISDVCLKPFQFSCWNPKDPNKEIITHEVRFSDPIYKICQIAAKKVTKGEWPDITKGATHYYASSIVSPRWSDKKKLTVKIGAHNFFAL